MLKGGEEHSRQREGSVVGSSQPYKCLKQTWVANVSWRKGGSRWDGKWELSPDPQGSLLSFLKIWELLLKVLETLDPGSIFLTYTHLPLFTHSLMGLSQRILTTQATAVSAFPCVFIWWPSSFCLSSHITWGSLSPHLDPVTLVLSHAQHFLSQEVSLSCSWHLEYSFPHTSPNGGWFVPHLSLLREAFSGSSMKNRSTHFTLPLHPVLFLLSTITNFDD